MTNSKSQINSKLKHQKLTLVFWISFLVIICNLVLGAWNFAFAQEGLVPCGPGTSAGACNFCHLITLAENVINFALYYIAVPIVVIMIIVGGIFIMTAGQSPERLNKGKEIIKAALVGILIAVLAWYIIDTVLNLVAPGTASQWWNPASKISCSP